MVGKYASVERCPRSLNAQWNGSDQDAVKGRVAKGLSLFLQKLRKNDGYNSKFAKTSLFVYVPFNLKYFVANNHS